MRLLRLFFITLAAFMFSQANKVLASDKLVPQIYAFGIAASFNDSTVYITDVQKVDSVWLEKKTNFLIERTNYSNQLRDYLAENKGEARRTCVFVYAKNMKDIMKKYNKTKQLYFKGGNKANVRIIDALEFRFQPVVPVTYVDGTDN